MNKVKTVVNIGGKEYTMSGNEPEEYIHRVAIYVDRKMSEIQKHNSTLSTTMTAVLTAVNIADELLKEQDLTLRLKEEIAALKNEITSLKSNGNTKRSNPPIYDMTKKSSSNRKIP